MTISLSAQLSFSPESIEVLATSYDEKIEVDLNILNTSDEISSFSWRIANVAAMPSDWQISVCDDNKCYPKEDAVYQSPASKPLSMKANSEVYYNFMLYPNAFKAKYTYEFELFDPNQPSEVYATIPITISTVTSRNSVPSNSLELNIFPNPAIEYFQIENDNFVKQVGIYNIVGKQLESHQHTPGKRYDVSNFKKGMYLVRLFDSGGHTLETLRLNRG